VPVNDFCSIAPDVKLANGVKLSKFINLYGCQIGENTKIGAFVEIQKNATVGKNCKVSSHSFICEGVTIEDNVFMVMASPLLTIPTHAPQRPAASYRLNRIGKSSRPS